MTLHSLGVPSIVPDSILDRSLKNNEPVAIDKRFSSQRTIPFPSRIGWEIPDGTASFLSRAGMSPVWRRTLPPIQVKLGLDAGGKLLEYSIPVSFRWTDQVDGELYRLFEVRPPVTLQIEEKVGIFAGEQPKKFKVKLKSHTQNIAGQVRLKGADAWKITPAAIPFSLGAKYKRARSCSTSFLRNTLSRPT